MREEFMHVYANLIQRSGSNNLLDWIESRTDFFGRSGEHEIPSGRAWRSG